MDDFAYSLCKKPWWMLCTHWELLLCYSLMGLMDTSPVDFRGKMFWEPIPLVRFLKIGALDVGPKSFAIQGEARSWGFFVDCTVLCWDGVYSKSMSQSSLLISMWVFSHSLIGVTQLVFKSPHVCNCTFGAPMAGEGLRSLLCHCFGQF